MEGWCKNKFILANFLILLGIFLLNFALDHQVKNRCFGKRRGYILDRNFSPIALSSESYRAYYLLNKEELGGKIPAEVKKYLPDILTLPEKGVIPLAENLDLDEAKKLSREKNVILQKDYKRKLLFPSLEPIIGKTFNGRGVSGIEKAFDSKLRKGEFVVLSLDTKLEKRLVRCIKSLKTEKIAVLVFNINTGELLAYAQKNDSVLKRYFYLSDFGIPENEISNFSWELGEEKVIHTGKHIQITLLHLADWIFKKLSRNVHPTLLYKKEIKNKKIQYHNPKTANFLKELKKGKIYDLENDVIIITLKRNKLIIIDIVKKEDTPDSYLVLNRILNTGIRRVLARL